jgi:hypothetical protein
MSNLAEEDYSFKFDFSPADVAHIAAAQLSGATNNRTYPIEITPSVSGGNFSTDLGFYQIPADETQFGDLTELFRKILPNADVVKTSQSGLDVFKMVADIGEIKIKYDTSSKALPPVMCLEVRGDRLIAELVSKGVTFPGSEVVKEKMAEIEREKNPLAKPLDAKAVLEGYKKEGFTR